MHVPAVYMSGRPAVSEDSGGATPDVPASATTCGSPRHAGMDGVGVAGGVPVRLSVPVALLEPVRVLLGDGVTAADGVCDPVNDVLGVNDGVQVLLGVMVDKNEGVGMEGDAGRHGSATPEDENDAGTAV